MKEIEILRKYILEKTEHLKSKVNECSSKIAEYELLLEKISTLVKQLDTDIRIVNIDDLEFVLNFIYSSNDVEQHIKQFDDVVKLSDFLYNSDIANVGIKNEMLSFIERISSIVKSHYENISKSVIDLKNKEKALLTDIEVLNNYVRDILNDSTLNNCSSHVLDGFFEFLDNSDIDKTIVLKLITFFTKSKLHNLEEIKRSTVKLLTKKIDENSKKVVAQLSDDLSLDETLISDVKLADLSTVLSDDEMDILKKVEAIIEKYKSECTNASSLTAIQLFDDFSLDTRVKFYGTIDSVDWGFVVADFQINLLKYLPNHKDEILEIFKYILEQYDFVESMAEEKENAIEDFWKLKKQLEDILEEETELFNSIDFSDREIGEYSWLIQLINNCGLSECSYLKDDYPVYDIALFVISNEIKQYLELLNVDITTESIDFVKCVSCLSEYIEKIRLCLELYNKEHVVSGPSVDGPIENPDDGLTEHQISSLCNSLQYNITKNLILLLPENGGYKPINDIIGETNPVDLSRKENEFIKCLHIFSNNSLVNRRKERRMVDLECTTSTGKNKTIEEVYGFKGERLRFSEYGRTGYVLVPVHPVNQKRLKKVYGDNLFSGFSSIPLIIGEIVCVANHDYTPLTDAISKNVDYINKLISVFGDPDVDIKILTNLIENSMEECKTYAKGINSRRGR